MTGTIVIGRNAQACQIVFPSDAPGVSGVHCRVFFDRSRAGLTITDNSSSYGTFVGGRRIQAETPVLLRDADSFTVGEDNIFTVHIR